jgi:O-antigen/teichoic acid export membrane protein
LVNHIDKIFWTAADKLLYVIYGFIFLVQISMLNPDDFALFSLLLAINTWIFIISDSFSLQLIIQFGYNDEYEKNANLYALIFHITITLGLSLILFLLSNQISYILNESRLKEILIYLPLLSILMIPRTYFGKFLLKNHNMQKIFWMDFFFFFTMSVLIIYFKLNSNKLDLQLSINIYFLGTLLSSIYATLSSIRYCKIGLKGRLPLIKVLKFNVPFTISNALANLPKQLDILIFKLFFDLHTIGIYQAAKSLYRLFEEGVIGANGLVYPALVKHFETKNYNEIYSIVSKGISFLFIAYVFVSIILLSGFSNFLISNIMKSNYLNSINYFNILLIGAIFLPLNILNFLLTSTENHIKLLLNVSIAFLLSIITMYFVGFYNLNILIPFGLISYNFTLAVLNYLYVKKHILPNFKLINLLRGFNDTKEFSKRFLNKL